MPSVRQPGASSCDGDHGRGGISGGYTEWLVREQPRELILGFGFGETKVAVAMGDRLDMLLASLGISEDLKIPNMP